MGKNKEHKSYWITGCEADEFDREDFVKTFAAAPLTIRNLINYALFSVDTRKYDFKSPEVILMQVTSTVMIDAIMDKLMHLDQIMDVIDRDKFLVLAQGLVNSVRACGELVAKPALEAGKAGGRPQAATEYFNLLFVKDRETTPAALAVQKYLPLLDNIDANAALEGLMVMYNRTQTLKEADESRVGGAEASRPDTGADTLDSPE